MGVDAAICEQYQHAVCACAQWLQQLSRLLYRQRDVGAAIHAHLRRMRGGSRVYLYVHVQLRVLGWSGLNWGEGDICQVHTVSVLDPQITMPSAARLLRFPT